MKANSRPTWDSIWINLAQQLAKRATCLVPNRQVGCVIVSSDNRRVLSVGYNGGAAGSSDECEYSSIGGIKEGSSRCTCAHAEMNALAKLNSVDSCAKTCYLTLSPCQICATLLVNAMIDTVIFIDEYSATKPIDTLLAAGIEVYQYDLENNCRRQIVRGDKRTKDWHPI